MIRSTTILGVLRDGACALAGDGQVTHDKTVIKHSAKKVRRLYKDQVLVGFAGSVADALTLLERFDGKLEAAKGHLPRAAYELVKEWRTDRVLRRLQAMLLAGDREHLFVISGTGDLIEPDDGIAAIGVGAPLALAAGRALLQHSQLTAREIAESAMRIAAGIDIYTNDQLTVESLDPQ